MNILKSVEFYAYSALASAVMVWAQHNPTWHDPAIWLMGVLGHAIGKAHAQGGNGSGPA